MRADGAAAPEVSTDQPLLGRVTLLRIPGQGGGARAK